MNRANHSVTGVTQTLVVEAKLEVNFELTFKVEKTVGFQLARALT